MQKCRNHAVPAGRPATLLGRRVFVRSIDSAELAEGCDAMSCRGSTHCAAPIATASPGMPHTTLVSSSCAMVGLPASRISRRPRAPSLPMPVSSTPMALRPAFCATERNSTSTEGLWRFTSGAVVEPADIARAVAHDEQVAIAGRDVRVPGRICCPSCASATVIWLHAFMRFANGALNAAGMCCVMTTPGESGGKPISTSLIASVPPVEAPMAMMRSVVRACAALHRPE